MNTVLMTRDGFLDPTRWRERTGSWELDSHLCTPWNPHVPPPPPPPPQIDIKAGKLRDGRCLALCICALKEMTFALGRPVSLFL